MNEDKATILNIIMDNLKTWVFIVVCGIVITGLTWYSSIHYNSSYEIGDIANQGPSRRKDSRDLAKEMFNKKQYILYLSENFFQELNKLANAKNASVKKSARNAFRELENRYGLKSDNPRIRYYSVANRLVSAFDAQYPRKNFLFSIRQNDGNWLISISSKIKGTSLATLLASSQSLRKTIKFFNEEEKQIRQRSAKENAAFFKKIIEPNTDDLKSVLDSLHSKSFSILKKLHVIEQNLLGGNFSSDNKELKFIIPYQPRQDLSSVASNGLASQYIEKKIILLLREAQLQDISSEKREHIISSLSELLKAIKSLENKALTQTYLITATQNSILEQSKANLTQINGLDLLRIPAKLEDDYLVFQHKRGALEYRSPDPILTFAIGIFLTLIVITMSILSMYLIKSFRERA